MEHPANSKDPKPAGKVSPVRMSIGILLSGLSGLIFYLAFPPLNLWPFIFLAPIPYLIAQHRLLPRKLAPLAPTLAIGIWLWPFLYRIFNIPDAPFVFQHMGLLIAGITYLTSTDVNSTS